MRWSLHTRRTSSRRGANHLNKNCICHYALSVRNLGVRVYLPFNYITSHGKERAFLRAGCDVLLCPCCVYRCWWLTAALVGESFESPPLFPGSCMLWNHDIRFLDTVGSHTLLPVLQIVFQNVPCHGKTFHNCSSCSQKQGRHRLCSKAWIVFVQSLPNEYVLEHCRSVVVGLWLPPNDWVAS